ncbi:hypothetical protein O1611_g4257 [Lasiodiplodia mahajangana]|uniref:Uncharacterized protein n=1 Tax=Lasiodiplodia mahajangana TaxID=1108764 RepID=A0ACC2JQ44_9PEZI|nr:hypothetical protein O1611_g4257 [Lasiodiplodia mahajangana]
MPSSFDSRTYFSSQSDSYHREKRKEIEKKHSISLQPVGAIALMGIGLLWNVGKEVKKYEEKREKEEMERRKREDRDRQWRTRTVREERFDSRRDPPSAGDSMKAERGSCTTSSNYTRETRRYQSPDYRTKRQHDDRSRDEKPRHHSQDSGGRESPYYVTRRVDREEYTRSRRESR